MRREPPELQTFDTEEQHPRLTVFHRSKEYSCFALHRFWEKKAYENINLLVNKKFIHRAMYLQKIVFQLIGVYTHIKN
jgi:hypothetical protein